MRERLSAILVFTAALALYLATAARGLWWGDGPELAAAAHILGVPHPPGYPLYMLLGHLVIRLLSPWREPYVALALLNALLTAAACGMMVPLFARALGDALLTRPLTRTIAAAGLALAIATAHTVWYHGRVPEVYPLTLALGVGLLLLAWPADRLTPRRAAGIALLAGLAATNHYSIVGLYPLAALALLLYLRRAERPGRALGTLAALAALPLLLYLYLPLRARAEPVMNWGNPYNLERMLYHMLGRQYQHFLVDSWPSVFEGALIWLHWWGRQWLPVKLPAPIAVLAGVVVMAPTLVGLGSLARRRPALGAGLLCALGFTLLTSMLYKIPDIDGYLMLALPVAAIGWIELAARFSRATVVHSAKWALLPAMLALIGFLNHYHELDISGDEFAALDARRRLEQIAPWGVLLGGDDSVNMIWYEQVVHGHRRDVAILSPSLIYTDWYRPYLFDPPPERPNPFHFVDKKNPSPLEQEIMLINQALLPAFRAGFRVYTTYHNILFVEYFSPRPGVGVSSSRPLPPRVPPRIIFELRPNPRLAAMSEAEVTREIENFFMTRTTYGTGAQP